MDAHIDENDYFIISKDFSLKENEELEFFDFYDICKKTNYTLTIKDKKIYFCSRLNCFGSLFYGNYAYEEPRTLVIKEIDPTLLLINIIYETTKIKEDEFKKMDLNAIVAKYIEMLAESSDEAAVESSKAVLRFLVEDYYENKTDEIEKICEKDFVSFTNQNFYKLNYSKILSYLDKKLAQISKENYRNCVSLLASFLPDIITDKFLGYKFINLDELEDSVGGVDKDITVNTSNINSSNAHSNLKRKKHDNEEEFKPKDSIKNNKKKNETAKKEKVKEDRPQGQKDITQFFKK